MIHHLLGFVKYIIPALENGDIVDIKREDLNKFVYQENGVTGEIYQFIPVIDKETNNMVLYSFDQETKTWFISETLPQVKITTNENNPGKCTYLDVLSGNLARSIREQFTIVFPDDAVNMGWDYRSGETGTAPIYLINGSENAMQLVNFCKIPADFLGLMGTIDIATVAVLNPNNSIGLINFSLGNDNIVRNAFLKSIHDGGLETGILRKPYGNFSESLKSVPLLYTAQNNTEVINVIQTNDNITDQVEKSIFVPAGR